MHQKEHFSAMNYNINVYIFLLSSAPEVLSREPYSHAVDWWSLGVIVCRMLTNEVSHLFTSSHIRSVIYKT